MAHLLPYSKRIIKLKFESKLIGLNTLSKPQLLSVNNETYPLNLRIGYTVF